MVRFSFCHQVNKNKNKYNNNKKNKNKQKTVQQILSFISNNTIKKIKWNKTRTGLWKPEVEKK